VNPMTLGDAFNRRKKLATDLQTWIGRLQASGSLRRSFRTQAIEGSDAFVPDTGSEKQSTRHYTVDECRARIGEIVVEDRDLALRISLTNQRARAEVEDLDGVVRSYTVPELLVLKGDVIPKLEQAARAVPLRADNVSIYEKAADASFVKHRSVTKVERKRETFSDKGLKTEEMILLGFDVVEITDFGLPARDMYNEIDRVQEYLQRVKHAINRANKTELAEG
jgi:hypothetical protein